MLDIETTVQSLSESLHDGLRDIDQLQIDQCERLKQMLSLRMRGGMLISEGEQTIDHAQNLIAKTAELRAEHIAFHRAARRDALRMAWPFTCPENNKTRAEHEPGKAIAE